MATDFPRTCSSRAAPARVAPARVAPSRLVPARLGVAALLACAGAAGCATTAPRERILLSSSTPAIPERPSREPAWQATPAGSIDLVLSAARASVGRPTQDCAGFVEALFARVGVNLLAEARPGDGGVLAFARYVKRHGRWHTRKQPAAGDLVFFHNSYDRNRDGKLDDLFTHVGIVDEVRADGTSQIIHSTNHGIVREPMNLLRPHEIRDEHGQFINASLRRKLPREPAHTPHLMSELFAGFGTVVQLRIASVHCARQGCGSRS
jgi:peptidoglycan DL-endopeptidase CwlO